MEERGIEPLALKLLAGLILLAAGLGIGLTMYKRAGKVVERLSVRLSVEPDSWTLPKPDNENFTTVQITVEPLLDFHGEVTLSADGQPSGVYVSFSPSSGTPIFYSSLVIKVTNKVNPGVYTLTIRARGNGAEAAHSFRLEII